MRRLALLLPVAAVLAALAALAPAPPLAPSCAAAGAHHAAVVLEHGDGSVETRCVAFDTAEINGEDLLNRSGIAWSGQTFGGFGQAICALDGEPARYLECPGRDRYWAIFVTRGGGSWQLSNVGISSLTIRDGDAEGFRYVPASGTAAAPPAAAGICATATTPPVSPTPRRSVGAAMSGNPAASATERTATVAPTAEVGAATEVVPTAEVGAATAALTSDAQAATASPGSPDASPSGPQPQPPGSPSGPDFGLMAAAVMGGGLAGLALLRLVAGRRRVQ